MVLAFVNSWGSSNWLDLIKSQRHRGRTGEESGDVANIDVWLTSGLVCL
jgi:hypothetical protein